MKNKKADAVIFSVGAAGYGFLELLWRGHTHWSMLLAGGVCFSFFALIGEKMKKCNIFVKALAGGAFITAIEFLFGIIFNIILKKKVWDYSKMPFNIAGQVCLLYSALWTVLSIICIPAACSLKKRIK